MTPYRSTTRIRGNAMGEMVLVLPLLFVVLSLLFLLGRGVVRAQRAQVMDRYEAWRETYGAPGPAHDGSIDSPQLNQLFFGSRAATIGYDASDALPDEATQTWITAAYDYSSAAGDLASRQAVRAPGGHTVTFKVTFNETNAFWQRYESPLRHSHTRIGNDWAHVNGWTVDANGNWSYAGPFGPNMQQPIYDVFVSDVDGNLAQLQNNGNSLAGVIRSLYLARPGYGGPTVTFAGMANPP